MVKKWEKNSENVIGGMSSSSESGWGKLAKMKGEITGVVRLRILLAF